MEMRGLQMSLDNQRFSVSILPSVDVAVSVYLGRVKLIRLSRYGVIEQMKTARADKAAWFPEM